MWFSAIIDNTLLKELEINKSMWMWRLAGIEYEARSDASPGNMHYISKGLSGFPKCETSLDETRSAIEHFYFRYGILNQSICI